MSRARFRYALEPVLLTRRWALDTLLFTLGEHHAAMAAQAALQARTQADYAAATARWLAIAASGQAHPVQTFAISGRFLADLARQLREQAAHMAELSAARDEVIEQVVSAQRAVDAAEQHRDHMQEQFVRKRLSADFKLADDQWNTLQTGASDNDH